jgi:hypothetical protein
MLAGVLVYVFTRFLHWGLYMRVLSVVGLLVPVVWAPLMIKTWLRRWEVMFRQWEGAPDAVYSMIPSMDEHANPEFQFDFWHLDPADGEEPEKRLFPWRRGLWGFGFLLVSTVCTLLMISLLVPFVQWYVVRLPF